MIPKPLKNQFPGAYKAHKTREILLIKLDFDNTIFYAFHNSIICPLRGDKILKTL